MPSSAGILWLQDLIRLEKLYRFRGGSIKVEEKLDGSIRRILYYKSLLRSVLQMPFVPTLPVGEKDKVANHEQPLGTPSPCEPRDEVLAGERAELCAQADGECFWVTLQAMNALASGSPAEDVVLQRKNNVHLPARVTKKRRDCQEEAAQAQRKAA